MLDGTLPGYFFNNSVSFANGNGTNAKVLVDVSPSQIVTLSASELPFYGELVPRQQILRGGCRVIDGLISSTDTATVNLAIYAGVQLTTYAASTAGQYITAYGGMGVVTTTATTNSAITRTVGSFITDGWQLGDVVMLFGALSSANNGTLNVVSNVAASTLTVTGTTGISVAETQGAGFRLVRVASLSTKAVSTLSGTNGTAPSVALLSGALMPMTDSSPVGMMLGQNGMLIVAPLSAVTSTKKVDVTANYGLY